MLRSAPKQTNPYEDRARFSLNLKGDCNSPSGKASPPPMSPLFYHKEEEMSWLRCEVERLESERRMVGSGLAILAQVLQIEEGSDSISRKFTLSTAVHDDLQGRVQKLCEAIEEQQAHRQLLTEEIAKLRSELDMQRIPAGKACDIQELSGDSESRAIEQESRNDSLVEISLLKSLLEAEKERSRKLESEFSEIQKSKEMLERELKQLLLREQASREALNAQRANTLVGIKDNIHSVKCAMEGLRCVTMSMRNDVFPAFTEGMGQVITGIDIAAKKSQKKLDEAILRYQHENLERKLLHNQVLDLKGSIRVFCRVRPVAARENGDSRRLCVTVPSDSEIALNIGGKPQTFTYDQVFAPDATQAEVFDEAARLVVSVMDGYNICIFAYGQTGSGKTFTMEGNENNVGLYYRSLERLFRIAEDKSSIARYEFKLSFMEIYNEQIKDLLEPRDERGEIKKLEVKADPSNPSGTYVSELKLAAVNTIEDCLSLMTVGMKNRSTSSTSMNERSSRSHSLLSIYVTCFDFKGNTFSSKLNLVDLAGSERLSRTGATGDRLKEAQHINKSLSALGNCISALVAKSKYIPFRDSKLTFVLAPSLGCESKTLMFACVSASEADACESICSLQFASRVRNVEVGPAKKRSDGCFALALAELESRMALDRKRDESEQSRAIMDLTHELEKVEEMARLKDKECDLLRNSLIAANAEIRAISGLRPPGQNSFAADIRSSKGTLALQAYRPGLTVGSADSPPCHSADQYAHHHGLLISQRSRPAAAQLPDEEFKEVNPRGPSMQGLDLDGVVARDENFGPQNERSPPPESPGKAEGESPAAPIAMPGKESTRGGAAEPTATAHPQRKSYTGSTTQFRLPVSAAGDHHGKRRSLDEPAGRAGSAAAPRSKIPAPSFRRSAGSEAPTAAVASSSASLRGAGSRSRPTSRESSPALAPQDASPSPPSVAGGKGAAVQGSRLSSGSAKSLPPSRSSPPPAAVSAAQPKMSRAAAGPTQGKERSAGPRIGWR